MNRNKLLFFALAGSMLWAGACDFSPSSPFAGFDDSQQQGASLTGRIQQGGVSSASSLTALGSGSQRAMAASSSNEPVATTVVVYVDDVEIGRVDVNDGAFTLRGLPDTFSLEFLDENDVPIGDERMEFGGVKPNQEIDIVVAVAQGKVVLIDEKRTGIDHPGSSGIELEGIARRVDFGSDPMTGSFDVNGQHVITRAGETSIRKGQRSLTLEDIQGKRVHVRGVFEGDDVFAFEIKLQDDLDDDDDPPPTGSTCNYTDPAKPNHILICHKGRTLSVSPDAWPGHQGHGDTCGPCN